MIEQTTQWQTSSRRPVCGGAFYFIVSYYKKLNQWRAKHIDHRYTGWCLLFYYQIKKNFMYT